MGIITLKIDDELERRLRERAASGGAKRGAISQTVEQALKLLLGAEERAKKGTQGRTFIALSNGRRVAEAGSLKELATQLEKARVSPRDVLVESVPAPAEPRRLGMRTTAVAR